MRDHLMRRCVVLTALIALSASAAEAQRVTLDSAARNTCAALLEVHDTRSADTVVIDRALASPVAPLRAAAARVVGTNRIAVRYATLRERVRVERDTVAARDAAFALGLAVDAGSCDALRIALASPSTAPAAAWSLGELNAACGEFAPLLASATTVSGRAGLLRVAGKWTAFPDSVVSQAFVRATNAAERWAALYALARARRPAGAALALRASRSPDAMLRELAARLMPLTLQPARDSLRVIARLDSLLRDRTPHVRIAAVRALATYRAHALAPFLRAWPLERDANVRVTMAQSVGTVASDTSVLWRRWWNSDTTHIVRRSLMASAWQVNAMQALQGADSLEASPDSRVRIAVIDGAAAANGDRYAPRIVERLTDADPRVRAAAMSALSGVSARVRDSIGLDDRLAVALRDDDAGVRAAALGAYRRSDALRDPGIALDGYERAMRDSVSLAREAALELLTTVWRRDSSGLSDTLVARLRGWPVPSDMLLPQRVRSVTPLAHWQPVQAAASVFGEYDRIVREVIVPSLAGRPPALLLETDRGPVRIELDGVSAPMTSDHVLRLARAGYFRALRFHRVVPAFVAQGGDPRGDGSGGPGYAIRDELNRAPYVRGAVGMALSGPDTGGSQFFLTLAPQAHLDGHYTVFGHVVSGDAAMDALVQGDRMRTITPLPR